MDEIKLVFIDDPSLGEVFADSPVVVAWTRDSVVHIELRTIRPDISKLVEKQGEKQFPVARLAMTVPTALAVQATLSQHLAELEKQGVLKRIAVPLPTEAKH